MIGTIRRLQVVNTSGERGLLWRMWIIGRVSVVVHIWPRRVVTCWWMPSVGVWLSWRFGRFELQVMTR